MRKILKKSDRGCIVCLYNQIEQEYQNLFWKNAAGQEELLCKF